MTSRDFCYWLMGAFEIINAGENGLNKQQAKVIKDHLNMAVLMQMVLL